MIIDTFISQLRAHAPAFGGRVAGAAEFVRGLKDYNTSLPLPAAYVLPLQQEAEPNLVWNGLQQIVHCMVGVVVELDAQRDRRGQAPAMSLDDIRAQVFSSVLNLRIDPCRMARGVAYSGARELDLDRFRLFYQFEFLADWQITDEDGVQPDAMPLATIEVDIFKAPPKAGDPPAATVVVPTGDPPYPPPTDGPWPDVQRD